MSSSVISRNGGLIFLVPNRLRARARSRSLSFANVRSCSLVSKRTWLTTDFAGVHQRPNEGGNEKPLGLRNSANGNGMPRTDSLGTEETRNSEGNTLMPEGGGSILARTFYRI